MRFTTLFFFSFFFCSLSIVSPPSQTRCTHVHDPRREHRYGETMVGYQVRSFYHSFVRSTVDNIVSLSRIEVDSWLAGLYGTIIEVIDTGAMI